MPEIEFDQYTFWNERKHLHRRPPWHPVVRSVFEPRARFCRELIGESKVSVLELGCGNGFLTYYLQQQFSQVIALDYSSVMLANCPAQYKIQASANALPFKSKSFDLVVESEMLHHIDPLDRFKVIHEAERVAKRGIVCFEPNGRNPLVIFFALLKKSERHALHFTKDYMQSLLGTRQSQVCSWLVPNLMPEWALPLGRFLSQSPMRHWGFDIWTWKITRRSSW